MQADRTQRTQEKENERSVRRNAVCYPVSTDFALKKICIYRPQERDDT